MEITEAQYAQIEGCLPLQRGNVSLSNLRVLNAILYVAEHGCKWRGLPKRFGNWHTIYTRMNRWSKSGAMDRVFEKLQLADRAHSHRSSQSGLNFGEGAPGWHRSIKKNGPQSIGKSRGGWTTKIHMVAADARTAITFALSPGNAHDAPEGRELLRDLGSFPGMPVIMDRAYEGNETRQLVLALDMVPVVPPKSNRVEPWRYDRALYKKRNEIERLFRRLKGYRRIFSRFEKLDCVFLAFLCFALIVEALR